MLYASRLLDKKYLEIVYDTWAVFFSTEIPSLVGLQNFLILIKNMALLLATLVVMSKYSVPPFYFDLVGVKIQNGPTTSSSMRVLTLEIEEERVGLLGHRQYKIPKWCGYWYQNHKRKLWQAKLKGPVNNHKSNKQQLKTKRMASNESLRLLYIPGAGMAPSLISVASLLGLGLIHGLGSGFKTLKIIKSCSKTYPSPLYIHTCVQHAYIHIHAYLYA